MYVDESGDPGAWQPVNPPSPHYILSGLILPAAQWQACFQQYLQFRRQLRSQFGLPLRTEIHAAELIRASGNLTYQRIRKRDRMALFEMCMQSFPTIFASGHVVNVFVNKQARYGQPNALHNVHRYFDHLRPILLRQAAPNDPDGIVRL